MIDDLKGQTALRWPITDVDNRQLYDEEHLKREEKINFLPEEREIILEDH